MTENTIQCYSKEAFQTSITFPGYEPLKTTVYPTLSSIKEFGMMLASIVPKVKACMYTSQDFKKQEDWSFTNGYLKEMMEYLRDLYPNGQYSYWITYKPTITLLPEIFAKIYYDMFTENTKLVPYHTAIELPIPAGQEILSEPISENHVAHYRECRNMLDTLVKGKDTEEYRKELFQKWSSAAPYWVSQIPLSSPTRQQYNFFGTTILQTRRRCVMELIKPLLRLGSVCKSFHSFIYSIHCHAIWAGLLDFIEGKGYYSPLLFSDLPTEIMLNVYAGKLIPSLRETIKKYQSDNQEIDHHLPYDASGSPNRYKTIEQYIQDMDRTRMLSFETTRYLVLSYIFLPKKSELCLKKVQRRNELFLDGTLEYTLPEQDYERMKKQWLKRNGGKKRHGNLGDKKRKRDVIDDRITKRIKITPIQ